MTINLDRDYLSLKPHLEAECARRGIGFNFEELNPGGYGDLMFVGYNGIHNVEIKQTSEILSDIDHLINQVKSQSVQSDFLWLFVYGQMEDAGEGSYSLSPESTRVLWEKGPDSSISRGFRRRHHRVNYSGHRKILWRFREVGIQVIEVPDLPALATELCLLYESAQTEGTTFSRLIVEKIRTSPYPPEKEAFIKTLMGLHPKWDGDEIMAEAVANGMEAIHMPLNISTLCALLGGHLGNWSPATTPLRSGKRTIGPAAVAKLRAALGC